jgi:hypothetical protein
MELSSHMIGFPIRGHVECLAHQPVPIIAGTNTNRAEMRQLSGFPLFWSHFLQVTYDYYWGLAAVLLFCGFKAGDYVKV